MQVTSTARSLEPIVHRAIKSLAVCVLLLVTLSLWSGLHPRTCLALGLPALCCLAASYGIFTYRLARKRFALDYWLDPGSPLHAWFTRHWMTAIASLVLGVSLTGFLAIFTALARPTDWYFLCAIAIVTPLVFTAVRVWPGRHFRQSGGARHAVLADILSTRLSGWMVFAIAAAGYTCANYYLPGPGEYIYPGSLERTVDAFATQAGSVCPVVDDTLRIAAVIVPEEASRPPTAESAGRARPEAPLHGLPRDEPSEGPAAGITITPTQ